MKRICVFAVHPDDETLMAGGTILKFKEVGFHVSLIIVTSISEKFGWEKNKVDERKEEIRRMAADYEIDDLVQLDLPTTQLDLYPINEIITKFSKEINKIKPNIVILPFKSDVHSDHRITFDAAYACTKNFRYPFIEKIWMGETLSETEFSPSINGEVFTPNVFIDVTSQMFKKLSIMEIYRSELMLGNHPRSLNAIKSLASYRGSRIGVKYAEAFQLLFEKI